MSVESTPTGPDLVSSEDVLRWGNKVVLVAFEVQGMSATDAERLVKARLGSLKVLMYNDSSDFTNGTADPIQTYAVLPVVSTLQDSL